MNKLACLLLAFPLLLTNCTTDNNNVYDLVVYGATPGGITAAIQAERMGKSAIIVNPDVHIGGCTTGGLTWTDYGLEWTIGGLADEFYRRIKEYYDDPQHWIYENQSESEVYDLNAMYMQSFEPKVALNLFKTMLEENGVELVLEQRLDLQNGVKKEGGRISSILTESGQEFSGSMFIDATYEGDLLAMAGVSYHVGRESEDKYRESLAGVLGENEEFRQPKKYFGPEVDPYDQDGNLLFGIQDVEMGIPGQGDDKIQAYNFRMCLSKHPDNQIPIGEPENYDAAKYELLGRYVVANSPKSLRDLIKVSPVPNLKTDINDGCPFSTDYIGANWGYPEGDYETRDAIIKDHTDFTKGLIYFIGNDQRIPQQVRDEMLQYGYAKDEFIDNGNWNPQLYIREARRMIGEYVMTQHDCRQDTIKERSIGIGSYGVDSHHIQRIVHNGEVINEGNFLAEHHPYEIPYQSIVPKQEDCTNLLVPVCVSSSHIAFGSIRMEPVYMILGQSAGTAAVLALENNQAVQEVEYQELRKRLIANGQKLKLDRANAEQPL